MKSGERIKMKNKMSVEKEGTRKRKTRRRITERKKRR